MKKELKVNDLFHYPRVGEKAGFTEVAEVVSILVPPEVNWEDVEYIECDAKLIITVRVNKITKVRRYCIEVQINGDD